MFYRTGIFLAVWNFFQRPPENISVKSSVHREGGEEGKGTGEVGGEEEEGKGKAGEGDR